MKKNYIQPNVAAEQVHFTSLMQAASPGAGINNGGNTDDIGGTPIGD